MTSEITIDTKELNYLVSKLKKMKTSLARYLSQMAHEAGEYVVKQPGLKRYPRSTEANQPGRWSLATHRPMGYYIRGRGWSYPLTKNGVVTRYKNLHNSERYGTQFYVKREGDHARIGNRASYAKWLTDEQDQSKKMAAIGWRKLIDVAREKMPQIKRIFNKWVQKALKESGL